VSDGNRRGRAGWGERRMRGKGTGLGRSSPNHHQNVRPNRKMKNRREVEEPSREHEAEGVV